LLQRYLFLIRRRGLLTVCLSLLGLLLSGSLLSPAQADDAPGMRLVVLVAPGLRADDLSRPEVPVLEQMLQEGESGWMDCRAARAPGIHPLRPIERPSTASLLLTLGCGVPAYVGEEAAPLTMPTYHALRVSPYPPPDTLQVLIAANRRLGALVGALGDLFHRTGLHTAVMGNLDTNVHDRSHYLLAMDPSGNVDNAGKPLLRKLLDETAPYGLRTDVPMLFSYYDTARSLAALRVIAFGDLYRANRYEALCLPEVAAQHRTNALAAFNTFLTGLRQRLQAEQAATPAQPVRLVLLSPGPPESSSGLADRFAPILLWGSGIAPGSLTSDTTRRTGLVSNTDLVATVADWLHQPPPHTAGHPIHTLPTTTPTPESLAADHTSLVHEAEVAEILGGVPMLGVLCALALLLIPARRLWPRLAATTAAGLVALPLGMLLLPLLHLSDAAWAGRLLALGVLLLALPAAWLSPPGAFRFYLGLIGVLCIVLFIGALTGVPLQQNAWIASVISADPTRALAFRLLIVLIWIWAGLALRYTAKTAPVETHKAENT